MIPMRHPAAILTAGTVMTHPKKIHPKVRQLTALNPFDTIPTPAVAPTMHIVLLTGMAN